MVPKPMLPPTTTVRLMWYVCEIKTRSNLQKIINKLKCSSSQLLTLVIGPVDGGVFVLERGVRGLNAAMLCDTPSASMNCSRSSMLVRPLAACGRRPVRITNGGGGTGKRKPFGNRRGEK